MRGILNGIDTEAWDPASDPLIAQRYTAETAIGGKLVSSMDFRERLDCGSPCVQCNAGWPRPRGMRLSYFRRLPSAPDI
jgi:hypothetical protein